MTNPFASVINQIEAKYLQNYLDRLKPYPIVPEGIKRAIEELRVRSQRDKLLPSWSKGHFFLVSMNGVSKKGSAKYIAYPGDFRSFKGYAREGGPEAFFASGALYNIHDVFSFIDSASISSEGETYMSTYSLIKDESKLKPGDVWTIYNPYSAFDFMRWEPTNDANRVHGMINLMGIRSLAEVLPSDRDTLGSYLECLFKTIRGSDTKGEIVYRSIYNGIKTLGLDAEGDSGDDADDDADDDDVDDIFKGMMERGMEEGVDEDYEDEEDEDDDVEDLDDEY